MKDRLLASRRYAIPAAIFLLVSITVIALKLLRVDQMQGDSALFFQVTDNIAAHGSPTSSVFAYVWAYLHSGLIKMPAAVMSGNPLSLPQDPNENVLRLHTYFILFPLGLLAKIIPTRVVLLSAFVLSFTGTVLLAYALLIRRGVGVVAAALFALIIVTHPAWGDSLLFGQFYPDRLFVFFGFALMVLAVSRKPNRIWLVAAAIACASVIERGGMIAGIALMLYALLYRKTATDATFKFWLGAASLVFGELMLKFVVINDFYGKFASVSRMLHEWQRPQFIEEAVVFGLINLALLVIAAFEWRAALISLAVMIPNIFGSFGGSEKIGWTTHYHSYYLPVLIWAAALGFVNAYRMAKERGAWKTFYAAASCVLLYLALIEPYSLPIAFSPARIAQTFVPKLQEEAQVYLSPQGMDLYRRDSAIAAAIPEGASVSTPESAMPYLYRGRTLYFLPMGIDSADYVILSFQKDASGNITYGGVLSARGPAEQERVNALILRRLRRDGYDLAHPTEIPTLGLAVVKRIQKPRYARS